MFILLVRFYMSLEKLAQKYLNCWIIEFVKVIKKTFNMQKHDNFPYVKSFFGKQLAKSLITRQKKKESSLYCTRYVIHRKQQLRNVLIPNGKYCVSYAWNDNEIRIVLFFRFDFGSLHLNEFRNRWQWRVSLISK